MAAFAVKIPFVYSCIMEFRRLGNSGLKVPVLCLGAATFGGEGEFFRAWGATDVAEATRLVDICLEAGVNLFDTADVYSQGRSEEILGQAIAGRRDKVLLSTKATFPMGEGPNDLGSSRHHLVHACEASLKRLGTDYIDIYHLHGFDATTPGRGNPRHPQHPGTKRQGPLHRLLQLLRLASHEVPGSVRSLRLVTLRSPPGLLLGSRS